MGVFSGFTGMVFVLVVTAKPELRCRNTAVKLIHNLPRSTYTYLVEGYAAKNQTSLRNQVLRRYHGFFHSLLKSPSQEVRILSNMVARDPSSNISDNLKYLLELTNLSPWDYSSQK